MPDPRWEATRENPNVRRATKILEEQTASLRGKALTLATVSIANPDGTNRVAASGNASCERLDGVVLGLSQARDALPLNFGK